jgi:hypothetical protein
VLINIITGVSPPHFDFVVYYVFKFLKRDCGTIPVAEIISGKIEFFSKLQRFLIATESSKYLLIFVLYVCVIISIISSAIILSFYSYHYLTCKFNWRAGISKNVQYNVNCLCSSLRMYNEVIKNKQINKKIF